MYYTSQWAHGVRANLSQALKIPQNKVRVVQPGYVGSGYGYRSGIDLAEIHSAILAKITGRPVHTTYTRFEDFVTRTHRPQFRDEMHLSVNKDGTHRLGPVQGHRQRRRGAQLGGQRLVVHHAGSVQDPEPEARSGRRLHQLATSRARIAASAIPTARSPSK